MATPAANSGQGLARNQWRIEYYDLMGMNMMTINSTNIDPTDPVNANLQGGTEMDSWGDIEGGSLAICRTPFYL